MRDRGRTEDGGAGPAKRPSRSRVEPPRPDHRGATRTWTWGPSRGAGLAVRALLLVALAAVAMPDPRPLLPRIDLATRQWIVRSPVTGRPVDNIEEFVAALPEGMRTHFTLVHQSRSPQGGLGDRTKASIDARFPRLILYSGDARLVVALTTNPDRTGYDIAEVLRFIDDGARFELSRFVLPAAVRRDPGLAELARHNGEIDPPDCLRCHGSDVRPLIDSYPLWPGFYGSVSDTFPEGSPELPAYREFIAARRSSGVFKQLHWPDGTSVPPYIEPAGYDSQQRVGDDANLPRAPNSLLGMALAELNRKRIERKLAASPLHERYRHGLIAVLLGCLRPPLGPADLEPVRAAIEEDNAARIDRLGFHPRGPNGPKGPHSHYLDMHELLFPQNVAEMLYVARALDVSPRDFSMSFEEGSLAFYDGILSGRYAGRSYYMKEDWLVEMMRRLARDEPEFAPYFASYHATANGLAFGEKINLQAALAACPLLAQRQLKIAALPPVSGPLPVRPAPAPDQPGSDDVMACAAPPAPIVRCGRCHEGDEAVFIGRQIPFSNPKLLGARLRARAASSERTLFDEILFRMRADAIGRMPPHGAAATPAEIDEMRKYLMSVEPRRGS